MTKLKKRSAMGMPARVPCRVLWMSELYWLVKEVLEKNSCSRCWRGLGSWEIRLVGRVGEF